MAQLNGSTSDALKGWAEARVAEECYSSTSDTIRDLVRRDQENEEARRRLVAAIDEGLECRVRAIATPSTNCAPACARGRRMPMRLELSRRARSDLDDIRDFSVRHLLRKRVHYPSDRKGLAMERNGDEVHLTEEEASGGEQPHIVRWVLGISLTLAVGLLSAVWIIGALTR